MAFITALWKKMTKWISTETSSDWTPNYNTLELVPSTISEGVAKSIFPNYIRCTHQSNIESTHYWLSEIKTKTKLKMHRTFTINRSCKKTDRFEKMNHWWTKSIGSEWKKMNLSNGLRAFIATSRPKSMFLMM